MANGKFQAEHLRVHPRFATYLRNRQERLRQIRQRDVTMMEVTGELAEELAGEDSPIDTPPLPGDSNK